MNWMFLNSVGDGVGNNLSPTYSFFSSLDNDLKNKMLYLYINHIYIILV